MRKYNRNSKSSLQEIELLQSYNSSKLKFLHHYFAKIVANSERSIKIWYPMSKPIQNASLPRLFKSCLNFFQAGISPIVSTVYYLPYALCLKAVEVEGSGPYLNFITYTLCTEQKLYLTSAKASPGSVYLLFCDSDLKIKTTPNWRTKLFSVKSTQILQLLWHLTRKSNCSSTLSVVFVFLFSGWNLDRVLLNWKSIKTKKGHKNGFVRGRTGHDKAYDLIRLYGDFWIFSLSSYDISCVSHFGMFAIFHSCEKRKIILRALCK